MGGGASVHKRRGDTYSDSSEDSTTAAQNSSAALGKKSSVFRIRRRKDKSSSQSSGGVLCRKQGSMGKLERAMKAAILIQRWYRQYLARMEIRRRYTWNIFQTVEYAGEQDQMKLYNFFNALLTHMPPKPLKVTTGKESDSLSMDSSVSSATGDASRESSAGAPRSRLRLRKRKLFAGSGTDINLEEIPVENDYKGPHVKLPMTLQNLQELIDGFKSKRILHARYVAMILRAAAVSLKLRPNFNQPSTVLSKQITICGDLHGKLEDLLVVFHKNGLPSPGNPYVFNGDYVDRGKKSMEIFLILLSCYLLNPEAVYLNRGNHEDHIMNMRYGFIREVRMKYKVFAGKILHMIDQVYRSLPLGTIVDGRVLIVHGGVSETTDLGFISEINRQKFVSILRPPMDEDGRLIQVSDVYSPTNESSHSSEWRQVLDILWSDPSTGIGCSPNTFRGGGSYFGSDVTENVLKRHGLELLIRSHECKPEGYEFTHDNKCLTIFSASNYYEEGSNKGAYVRLLGGPSQPLEPYFVQFNAGTPKLRNMTVRQRIGLVEASAIRELLSILRDRQEALLEAFGHLDPDSTGLISVSDWCVAIEEATQLKLPWRLLRARVAELDKESGMVKYHSTFQEDPAKEPDFSWKGMDLVAKPGGRAKGVARFDFAPCQDPHPVTRDERDFIYHALRMEEDCTVVDVLYRNKTSLEAIFRIIDKDNSGYISMEEFADACDLLGMYLASPIPQQQMTEMARCMDMNKDGKIDLNEFLETFRIVSSDQAGADESLEYEEQEAQEPEAED